MSNNYSYAEIRELVRRFTRVVGSAKSDDQLQTEINSSIREISIHAGAYQGTFMAVPDLCVPLWSSGYGFTYSIGTTLGDDDLFLETHTSMWENVPEVGRFESRYYPIKSVGLFDQEGPTMGMGWSSQHGRMYFYLEGAPPGLGIYMKVIHGNNPYSDVYSLFGHELNELIGVTDGAGELGVFVGEPITKSIVALPDDWTRTDMVLWDQDPLRKIDWDYIVEGEFVGEPVHWAEEENKILVYPSPSRDALESLEIVGYRTGPLSETLADDLPDTIPHWACRAVAYYTAANIMYSVSEKKIGDAWMLFYSRVQRRLATWLANLKGMDQQVTDVKHIWHKVKET